MPGDYESKSLDMSDINEEVAANEDVKSFEMETLREAYGAGRLGKIVTQSISDELAGMGLGHHPDPLPQSQREWVLIYRLGTPVAELINAVLNPGRGNDEQIRMAISQEAEEALRKIREIVEIRG